MLWTLCLTLAETLPGSVPLWSRYHSFKKKKKKKKKKDPPTGTHFWKLNHIAGSLCCRITGFTLVFFRGLLKTWLAWGWFWIHDPSCFHLLSARFRAPSIIQCWGFRTQCFLNAKQALSTELHFPQPHTAMKLSQCILLPSKWKEAPSNQAKPVSSLSCSQDGGGGGGGGGPSGVKRTSPLWAPSHRHCLSCTQHGLLSTRFRSHNSPVN
jgi:hypothetical protein